MDWIKRLFRPASPEELAARELDSARRQLLEAQSAREYADAMVTYHRSRIERLRAVLAEEEAQ
jgi:hypothetical protein